MTRSWIVAVLLITSAVASAAPPPSACDSDADSSECKCSKGDTEACLRIAETERRHGSHEAAIVRVLSMCQSGIPLACFVGEKYMTQLHVDSKLGTTPAKLHERALALYDQKCAANELDLCVELAQLLLQGKYVAVDVKRSHELVEKACSQEHARACYLLGGMYLSGQGVKRDTKRAIALLEKACTSSGGAACTSLADQLVKRDKKRAHELYARACEGDDADGCARSGEPLKACEQGDLESCVLGGTQATDPVRARAAFQTACDADIGPGCAALAPMVAQGKGGPHNFAMGLALADKACKLKAPKACGLGAMLRKSPPQVSCNSVETCQPLCDEEIPKACVALADAQLKAAPAGACDTLGATFALACDGGDMPSCVKAANLSSGADAAKWYGLACTAKDAHACLLRDAVLALTPTAQSRARQLAALQHDCKPSAPEACGWYGKAILRDKQKQAETFLAQACGGGFGRACGWLAASIDTNPTYGIGDGSPSRYDEKLAARVDDLYARGCTLGDRSSCERAADRANKPIPPAVAGACVAEPMWAP